MNKPEEPFSIAPIPRMAVERAAVDSAHFLLHAISDGIVIVSSGGDFRFANRAAQRILGYTEGEIEGRPLQSLVLQTDLLAGIVASVREGDVVATDELRLKTAGGGPIEVLFTLIPLQTADGAYDGCVGVFRDITPSVLLNLALKEREELLRGVFQALESGIIMQNREGFVIRMNEAARGLLGMERSQLRGQRLEASDWAASDLNQQPIPFENAPFNRVLDHGPPSQSQICLVHNTSRYLLINSSMHAAREDTPPLIITTLTDVDEQVRMQRQLEGAIQLNNGINELLTNLLTERGAPRTIETGLSGACVLTGACCGVLGITDTAKGRIQVRHSYGLRHFEGFVIQDQEAANLVPAEGSALCVEDYANSNMALEQLKAIGKPHALIAPVLSEGELTGIVHLFRARDQGPFTAEHLENIKALVPVLSAAILKATYEDKLNTLATTDSLTGLWNRRVFFRSLQKEALRAVRYRSPFSVLMLDLDHFKQTNDVHGHLAGDEVLINLAKVLNHRTRSTDMVARTGGEEFMILLPETGLKSALLVAEKIRGAIEQMETNFEGKTLKVTGSLGVAEFQTEESLTDFYARLDRLLYRAKDGGRNTIASSPNKS